jgi:integrase/recombinase XerD
LVEAADAFADWLTAEGRAVNTVAAYRRDINAYLRWCAGAGAAEAQPLAAYVEQVRATRAPSSAARAVVALRIFHRWRDGVEGVDTPTPELAGVPIPAANDDAVVTEEAIARLWRVVSGETIERRRDAVVIGLLYFGGLKASEAISLDTADVAAGAAVVTVDRDGAHERLLPAVPALQEALTRWLDPKGRARLSPSTAALLVNRRGQRLTRQGLWLVAGAASKRAGLEAALSPNDLRRACAAHLSERGLPSAQVSAFLGHSRGRVPTLRILSDTGWGSCNLAV